MPGLSSASSLPARRNRSPLSFTVAVPAKRDTGRFGLCLRDRADARELEPEDLGCARNTQEPGFPSRGRSPASITAAPSLKIVPMLLGGMRAPRRFLATGWRTQRTKSRRQKPTPRDFLLEMLPKHSVCAEIGVWRGRFSARILEVVRPARLHLIDPWLFMTDDLYSKSRYGGSKAQSQVDMERIYESVLERFRRPIAQGIVQVDRSTSEAAAAEFEDGYFDWVYIDGNHLYEFVRRDLELYFPKVKGGGLVAGDDYGETGWWEDGVTRAVNKFASSGRCELVLTQARQFVLRKP
jgi:hypothetical protein